MIRAFAVFLGLWLGLCLALVFGGTLGHLRMVSERTGWALPGWVAGLEDDSGFTQGQGDLAGAAFDWRLAGWDGFDLSLSGPDWQATARAEPEGAAVRIGALSGSLALDWLGAGPGLLALEGGDLLVGLDGQLREGRIDAQAEGGPVTLLWEGGGWRIASR
ncbi:hypothetical protein [Pararhodobacter aggregans]|uniref:Type II secretion system protein N n=1 Tax=Pararhodobacter aggregans TaxID=404875 RepID=A0A2T7UNG9_9RHOB|nr:hypothetical protein [Pararhodobacter aggregans]PTX00716.1 hypothetical protein C8N33_10958 [Pararhodobacter aggregans]PVE46253.1 hypothetical protein DDE23_16525 [Pararhodobacter aggregans]